MGKHYKLEDVTGGATECMQEVEVYADHLFFEVISKHGTATDLQDAKVKAEQMLLDYSTKLGKIMQIEVPMVQTYIDSQYEFFLNVLKNGF